mmetsp:Transcript_45480/g.67018  ORF Transcript_45480/g.67018 Transcript_45480/m.67018 type:complete len:232 (+) Transcript_45480:157-852(+)|eukprot:CAMPEP_0195508474 /NCGR_PEP_ID=MMETSP0794_2-20130614/1672_1 /TAXON_ID=515487 /ORGANISM="Stephanopyxis turris, Strain CCMP 815" /LENGTH=231 /DNA_ID=CAMNT_0040635441 /DNA_START=55 /DNA_END=750 /DNA_ORIENTATION=+
MSATEEVKEVKVDAAVEANVAESEVEEVKIYVGNLDYSTSEARVREEFQAFGEITDVFLPLDRFKKRPRGFGLVTFSTRRAAEEAIAKMDQTQLDGRTIRVNESRPRGEGPLRGAPEGASGGGGGFNSGGDNKDVKLYVGNMSYDTTEETVRATFQPFGDISDCFLPMDRDRGRPRGFAFVTMAAADAAKAIEAVNGMEVDGRPLKVNPAQAKGSWGGGGRGRHNSGGGNY